MQTLRDLIISELIMKMIPMPTRVTYSVAATLLLIVSFLLLLVLTLPAPV